MKVDSRARARRAGARESSPAIALMKKKKMEMMVVIGRGAVVLRGRGRSSNANMGQKAPLDGPSPPPSSRLVSSLPARENRNASFPPIPTTTALPRTLIGPPALLPSQTRKRQKAGQRWTGAVAAYIQIRAPLFSQSHDLANHGPRVG
ncbi:hypothetical protein VTN02DRAFT_6565 [Thermoascus thermophilus]